MKRETIIGLAGGVLLADSVDAIADTLLVQPFFGTNPDLIGHLVIATVTLLVLAKTTDRYDA
jgi:hypothetical protein